VISIKIECVEIILLSQRGTTAFSYGESVAIFVEIVTSQKAFYARGLIPVSSACREAPQVATCT